MDIFDEMAEDAKAIPSNDLLEEVSKLAELQVQLDQEVYALEEQLKAKKAEFNEVAEHKLPNAMAAVHLKEFKLTDGTKITVKPYYGAKIDDSNREQCHNWLEEHGYADIIKHQIGVSLGKGESETAELISTFLQENGITFSDKEGVHWSTLTAFVREQVESGGDLPLELFQVHIGQVAKIKRR